jgi:DNA polymerase III delta prime subunit
MSEDSDFQDSEFSSFEEVESAAPSASGLSDPALVAADELVRAATADPAVWAAVTAAGACVVVLVPGDMAKAVASAWKRDLLGLKLGLRNARGGPHLEVRHGPSDRPSSSDDHEAQVAMWAGKGALGVALGMECLSSALVRGADVTVTIPPMGAGLLRTVVHRVTGTRPGALPRGLAGAVSARHLRLARRPGQTTDDYVRRLAGLVAADKAEVTKRKSGAPRWTLDNLYGMDAAVAWGRSWARDVAAWRAGELAWQDVDRGAVLAGPPGCGKTTFAAALAASSGAKLLATSYAQWDSAGRYQSETLKAMRTVFEKAARLGKEGGCILLIDELDALPARGTAHHNEAFFAPLVTGLLEALDSLDSRSRTGVLVLGCTNHPGVLDPALVRAGRMDRTLHLGLPDRAALARILGEHLAEHPLGEEDLGTAARAGLGGSGADAERWARGARRRARQASRPVVTADLLAEIGEGHSELAPGVRRRMAIHEAGHAVAAVLERPGMLASVELRDTGDTLAATYSRLQEDEGMVADLEARLRGLLAGRAAEELLLGSPSGGAGGPGHSDLAVATRLAVGAETALGLGSGGLLWRGDPTEESLPTLLATTPGLVAATRARLDAAHAGAMELLQRERPMLEAVAAALLERGSLTGEEVEAIARRAGQGRTPASDEVCVAPGAVR